MAKNTTTKVSTEEFIESMIKKVLEKQSAQGQVNYVQVLDKNGNPPQIPVGVLTTNGNYNHGVYGSAFTDEYVQKLSDAYNDPKISTSVIDNELNLLSEKVSVTNHLLDVLIKKLNSVLPNREASYLTTDNKQIPQLEIPMCDRIHGIGVGVSFANDKINYLIDNVGV